MSKNEKKSFVLYYNFANQFNLLSMEERGMLISAIFEYAEKQSVTAELPPLVNMAFSCIKDTLDRDRAEYEEKCEQNAANGRKGGRPRKDIFLPKTERFFEKAKKADNDSDNDNDNDSVIDSGNGNENESENDIAIDSGRDSDNDNRADRGKGAKESSAFGSEISSATRSAVVSDKLSEHLSEKKEVFKKEFIYDEERLSGIPKEYIRARIERAAEYAKERGIELCAVLAEWWQKDSRSPPRASRSKDRGAGQKSYDIDDFFEAALKNSEERLVGSAEPGSPDRQ